MWKRSLAAWTTALLGSRTNRSTVRGFSLLRSKQGISSESTILGCSSSSSGSASVSSFVRDENVLKRNVMEICQAGLDAVDPYQAVKNHLVATTDGTLILDGELEYRETDFDAVLIVAFGKASSAMATSMARIVKQAFPSTTLKGHVIVKDGHATKDEWSELVDDYGIQITEASHPVPNSIEAAQRVWSLCEEYANNRTLVLCGISGGGSALFCYPHPSLSLEDLQTTSQLLLQSGMPITDMNSIRIQLERGKGGKFAAHAVYPSTMATLVLSDIIGDPLSLIASGPTVPSPTMPTKKQMEALLQQYQLQKTAKFALPSSVLDILLSEDDQQPSSSLQDHAMFSSSKLHMRNYKLCETRLVGNNAMAVQAAAKYARDTLGYTSVKILSTAMEGEAKHVAQVLTRMAIHQLQQQQDQPQNTTIASPQEPTCWIVGGETTVTLNSQHSNGKGGRNQELALAAALDLFHNKIDKACVTFASIGTDGTDGPTDAAGAIINSATITSLENANKALLQHNAYPYLQQQSALVFTGPTGTNVADIMVILIHPPN